VHDVDAVLFRHRHDALEERQLDALRRRIARKIDDEHFGLGIGILERPLELIEEIDFRGHPHVANICARDHRTINVNRVTGIRHEHDVAAVERRQHEMRDAFFRADRDNRFRVLVELDREAALVPIANRPPQPRNSFRHRIAVGIRPARRFDQLIEDVPRRGLVRVPHAEIDDVLPALARSSFELGSDIENVGGKTLDAGEFGHFIEQS
jgi:hypothetical protein